MTSTTITGTSSLASAPLGRFFDQSIAKIYKRSVAEVRRERVRRGIAKPSATGIAKLLALLLKVGTARVGWLALCEGRSVASVRRDLARIAQLGFCVKESPTVWTARISTAA